MLNPTQRATVLAAVKADTTANGYRTAGDAGSLLTWLNSVPASPTLAWSVNVQPQTTDEACNWPSFDTLTQGKRDSWTFFLQRARDFSRGKVRKWITDVWGNATAGSDAEAILQAGTENATAAQVALGGASKTTGTVTALDRTFTGMVGMDDVNWMLVQA